jgi:energy-coupling factor transporter ATP-binding protein EcfA2
MRLLIQSIRLVGTNRYFEFKPGLNIIAGSIATGKTTLQKCLKGLLGSNLDNFSHEARNAIKHLAGHIVIGNTEYDVIRPFSTTRTALIDIAGDDELHRYPAMQATENYSTTYGKWLLQKLGLPVLEVPSAPTQADSTLSPVTINDYLMYCYLQQGEIDNNVFGHTDQYKNVKRKYVFDILYGKYSIEIAQLRDDLRKVTLDLRRLQDQSRIFQEFIAGTPFENQAQIEKEFRETTNALKELELRLESEAVDTSNWMGTVDLRRSLQLIELEASNTDRLLKAEKDSQEQLAQLLRQLQNQSKRLTRSIVADELLTDIDFIVCPRCGSSLASHADESEVCYLCKETIPSTNISRNDLAKEQDRLERQIDETRELIAIRGKTIDELQSKLGNDEQKRQAIAHEIDFATNSYVSDHATLIAEAAKHRAEMRERIRTLTDFLQMFNKLNEVQHQITKLETAKADIEGKIDEANTNMESFDERVRYLEARFREILDQFHRPEFPNPGITGIDKGTYLPKLDGRRFDELQSQGLIVMVNVAHALAHQLTSLHFGLHLPNILFIDGLTGNMGYEGLDQVRIESIYSYLISLSRDFADKLQIIVVDNSVPALAKEYVRVEFTEDNKLIPSS